MERERELELDSLAQDAASLGNYIHSVVSWSNYIILRNCGRPAMRLMGSAVTSGCLADFPHAVIYYSNPTCTPCINMVLIMKFSASLDLRNRAKSRFYVRAPHCSCTGDASHWFLGVSGTYYWFDPRTNSSPFEKIGDNGSARCWVKTTPFVLSLRQPRYY